MRLTPSDPDEIICVCRGISRGQIQQTIALHQVTSVEGIARTLGASAECGACAPLLQELLGDSSAWTEVDTRLLLLSPDPADPHRIVQVDFHFPEGKSYPRSAAGQFVTVQGLINGQWLSRTYTLINPGAHHGVVRVAMRRVPEGQFTPWLLDEPDAPKRVRISAPMGDDYWAGKSGNTVCLVGGIGVTLAKSLIEQLPEGAGFRLDYSARSKADHVFIRDFQALGQQNPRVSVHCRSDDTDGYITKAAIGTVARDPADNYVVCGPPKFLSKVHAWLLQAGIPSANIHLEKFSLSPTTPVKRRSWKTVGYSVGMVVSLLPAVWLLPAMQNSVPHHAHNIGHEKLECSDCHQAAPGTLRQQLQAKVDFWLGRRQTDAALGFKAVDNRVCLECHRRDDDRHPTHRFLEPRFQEVRASLGPQHCLSCHREHQQVRVTLPDTGYCSTCHSDLEIKADRTVPTHTELIKTKRWETCLSCHDFHNNHGWKEPVKLTDAIPPERIRDYFGTGQSPYGEAREKALTRVPAIAPKN